MRAPPTLLALLLLAPTALAQEDACTEEAPCPWVVDLGGDGIDGDDLNATVGDWYVIEAFNLDTEEHTLTLESHDVTLTVPAFEEATSDPIAFDTTGAFALEDDPTGDVLWLEVRATDVVDDSGDGDGAEGGADDEGAGAPLPLAVLLAALTAALVLRRR